MNVQYSLCDEKILNPKHGIDPIVERLIDLLPQSASIFDVGAGEGRNSIPLVRAGYRVSVADKNLIRLRSDAILQNISLQYYE